MPAIARRFCLLLILAASEFAACGCHCAAAEDDLPRDDEAAATFTWAKAAFAEIDCRSSGKDSRRLESHDQPLLRWSNPAVGRIYGDVFLLTSDGRPAALVSLYQWYSPYESKTAEFLSLSEGPLKAVAGEQVLWNTGAGGLNWETFEPGIIPANTAPARLSQMRGLVARFEIVLDDRRNDARGDRHALRKLTRPIFRYGSVETGIVDGGLFAFVAGTDPEAFLLIEAREESGSGKSWHYALARMNCDALTAKLDGAVVERFASVRDRIFDPKQSYSAALWPQQRNARQPAESIAEEK